MSDLFEWDELNLLKQDARQFIRDAKKRKPEKDDIDRFCDYMEYVFCLIYMFGWKDAEEIVGPVDVPTGLDDKAVNLEIKGETFRERAIKQVDGLSEDGLLLIIKTEAHRDYNTGYFDAGQNSRKDPRKHWNTMLDELVRDTHSYLEGAEVGMNDLFYTFDGDSALYPGGFTLPENNAACRCWITYTL